MDKGEFIRNGYTVEPGVDGSFVVYQGTARNQSFTSAIHGFSNHHDLLSWLSTEHSAEKPRDQKLK